MTKSVRAVQRALDLLGALSAGDGQTLGQLAGMTGLSRGTAHRLLATLQIEGMVELDEHAGRYWLSDGICRLMPKSPLPRLLAATAEPVMKEFTHHYGWPVKLVIPDGKNMVVRLSTDPISAMVYRRYGSGHTVPTVASASGRAYLAFLPAEERSTVLAQIAVDRGATWAEENRRLALELRQVRKQGFSMTGSPEGTTISIGAPILVNDRPSAVLTTRYFKATLSPARARAELAPPLVAAADMIIQRLSVSLVDETTSPGRSCSAPPREATH